MLSGTIPRAQIHGEMNKPDQIPALMELALQQGTTKRSQLYLCSEYRFHEKIKTAP